MNKNRMKAITFSITVFAVLVSGLCVAQGGASEAVSRQVQSLRSAVQSFADAIGPRVELLENDVSLLKDNELARQACFGAEGEARIYWPSHADANNKGCVLVSNLGTAGSSAVCDGELVNGENTCDACTAAGGTPYADPEAAGAFFCKFNSTSCPAGFTGYKNWGGYSARTCSGGAYGYGCSVGGAPFNNYTSGGLPLCVYQTCRDTNKGCTSRECYPARASVGCY